MSSAIQCLCYVVENTPIVRWLQGVTPEEAIAQLPQGTLYEVLGEAEATAWLEDQQSAISPETHGE